MTVITRWARVDDATLPFIATGIPPSVVSARIDGRFIAVAEVAGEPVGGLQLEYLWGALPYIAMIRVLSHWQRRGVGRTLLGFVETALSAAGHSALLSSSQANEPEPQAWHLRMGFDAADCWRELMKAAATRYSSARYSHRPPRQRLSRLHSATIVEPGLDATVHRITRRFVPEGARTI